MKRLLILLFVLISLGSFGQGRIVVKVPSVTIPSSLPSMTGNGGKYLTTDGTTASWGTITGATPTGSTSSATTLTLTTDYDNYVFTGSSATTWTLPAVSGNSWKRLTLVNTGTAAITVQRAGSDNIYTTSAVTSLTIYPGEVYELLNTSTYWKVK